MRKLHIMSAETILNQNREQVPGFCHPIDFNNPDSLSNPSNIRTDAHSKLTLFVDPTISFNEFILMLRNKFFQDCALEDFTLYHMFRENNNSFSHCCYPQKFGV